jgi:hypothetical protein
MGSMVYLKIGNLEVDWGKNNVLTLHGAIFQKGDVTPVQDTYVTADGEQVMCMQNGASRDLRTIVPRLKLMGYSLEAIRDEFESLCKLHDVKSHIISFEELADALKKMDVNVAADDYHTDYQFGDFFARHLIKQVGLKYAERSDLSSHKYEIGMVMESLHPYSILRLLSENELNLNKKVSWHFHDVVDSGWVDEKSILQDIGKVRRFMIVTEGSSDSNILRHALEILHPEIADFFNFIDMQDGYPFTGTGNLHNFCKGLVAIGIENNVIVLYDNDLEGSTRCKESNELPLPANMKVTKLPVIEQLSSVQTIGPGGMSLADINGYAAAIECYLDWNYKASELPLIRWSSFNHKAQAYQGALENKQSIAKRFLDIRHRNPEYDFQKIEIVLSHLCSVCSEIAEAAKIATINREICEH